MYGINCIKIQTLDFSTTITKQSYMFVQPYKCLSPPGVFVNFSVSSSHRVPPSLLFNRPRTVVSTLDYFTSKFSLPSHGDDFHSRSKSDRTHDPTLPPMATS